jgi:tungstate transport system substrate-binding protein
MHNDFIIVGPASDPAKIADAATTKDAMTAIATSESPFISRGDDSGTNALELKQWEAAAIDPSGSWYEESGQGMGATLQIASQRQAYTISDRATFLAQQDSLDLEILFEGQPELLNVYHVIVVNPDKHTEVNADGARAFSAFLVRPDIQEIIGKFGVEEFGEPLFFADAGKPEPTS